MKNATNLIETIKKQGLKPVPKWYFIFKKAMIYLVFFSAVVLGALAFSVVLFSIQQTDFNILGHLTHSKLEFFLSLLPFAWMLGLLMAISLSIISLRQSPKGYKFALSKLIGYNAAISIILGTIIFMGGGGQQLENAFAIHLSLYESMQEKKVKLWSMPDQGFLSGQIITAQNGDLKLLDFNKQEWSISYKQAFVAPIVLLENGEKIKIIGKVKGPHAFEAAEIRPWDGRSLKNHNGVWDKK